MLLKGKTAVITGASRGIGKAIAQRFAAEGAKLVLIASKKESIQPVAEALGAQFWALDVSKTAAVDQAAEEILAAVGSVDILVNNAGITRDGLLMRMSEQAFDEVLAVNLKSVYNFCHAFVRSFVKAKSGKIINISSIVGQVGNAGQTNYAASKAGMIGFTQSLALELAARGITANCIAPGFIESDMTAELSEQQKNALLSRVPMQRMGKPEEIANAALFLASDLSNYMTGQVLTVDGGMVM